MVSGEALKKLQEQIAAWPMAQRFATQQLIEEYLRNREDLRAYQATGLTPESVEALKLSTMGKAIAEVKEFNGLPVNRLRELAEADKAGRVVVTRCKDCKHGEVYDRTDGKKGIYCHCPRSIFYYGNGSIFAPVRENLDFCSYGEPKEGDHA